MESESKLIDPSAGHVGHKLPPFLTGRGFLCLLKFKLEKLKLGLELRIIVSLLSGSCGIFEVFLIVFLLREIIVIVENAAIIEGLLRDDDLSLNDVRSPLDVLPQFFRIVVIHVVENQLTHHMISIVLAIKFVLMLCEYLFLLSLPLLFLVLASLFLEHLFLIIRFLVVDVLLVDVVGAAKLMVVTQEIEILSRRYHDVIIDRHLGVNILLPLTARVRRIGKSTVLLD